MLCPYCGEDQDHVIDSRAMAESTAIRRRRECLACGRRFTTYEHIDDIPLTIVKRDGGREPFDREKVAASIRVACHKRPINEDKILEITGSIEKKILSEPEKEVESTTVGEMVMEHLRHTDQVAYVRFASVYRSFKDVTEFMDELSHLLEPRKEKKSDNKKRRAKPKVRKKAAK